MKIYTYYLYYNKCNYTTIILLDYFINTIDAMQNEKDFFHCYNEFENNKVFEIVFRKIALLEYEFLYEKEYYKILFS